ncbi:MAG: hypothetical protein CMN55_08360 [Sneathiella sp.]|jgi:hypothetical protein|uniref:hypothetical protein n=1 Tax=Sneathiella sp. TaxID=1964365 RepID=UPI000C61F9FB|nr:hypothetical protein [Sneathiella sp.]MAL79110.1 hypothetical protein [Sneathiella sp.]|tara:strand:- start:8620 stop:8934 length:315 start_codon:yes stop_codon:yes gene_type:complete
MTEKKKQLGNVAFGGNWSEELVDKDQLQRTLSVIERAVRDCARRDVRSRQLEKALEEISRTIEKGPQLTRRFMRSLAEPNPSLRYMEAGRVARIIRRSVGGLGG